MDDIFVQTQRQLPDTPAQRLPGFLSRFESKPQPPNKRLSVDSLLDPVSGQQTELMLTVEQKIGERMRGQYPQWELRPFRESSVSQAQYLMAETLAAETQGGDRKLRLNLSLTDRGTGLIVAQTREAISAKVCLNLVGHTSRTGPEQVNVKLSQQRASFIKQRLEAESPALSGRLRFAGVGWRENLVGIGSDDARDALDRRVEFRVVDCTTA